MKWLRCLSSLYNILLLSQRQPLLFLFNSVCPSVPASSHFSFPLDTCVFFRNSPNLPSPSIHQNQSPTDFPTRPSHLTPISTCPPVPHYASNPHSIYTSPCPPAPGQIIGVASSHPYLFLLSCYWFLTCSSVVLSWFDRCLLRCLFLTTAFSKFPFILPACLVCVSLCGFVCIEVLPLLSELTNSDNCCILVKQKYW